MVRYHTVNIGKKVYQKIKDYAETETIFDNVKAFILHAVANQMKDNADDTIALNTLEKIAEDKKIEQTEIQEYLNESRKQFFKE